MSESQSELSLNKSPQGSLENKISSNGDPNLKVEDPSVGLKSKLESQNSTFTGDQKSALEMLGLSSNMSNVLNGGLDGVSAGALNAALSAVSKTSNLGSSSYRDFSRVPADDQNSENTFISTTASGKDPPFPAKLHKILSNPEFRDYIMWLPHGRSWRVLKPKAFEEKVIPLYFRHAKYASFMRQVNGWGFKRMTQGPDHNSYYHELFLRGLPHLCMKMRRPAKSKSSGNDSETNPDFYRISMVAPLPNSTENTSLNTVQPQDLLAGITNAGAPASTPAAYAGLQNVLNLQNTAITPGFNMGLVGAAPQIANFDPSSLTSATELLQQHIQNQLQQQGTVFPNQQINGTQNAQLNGITQKMEDSSGDSIGSNGTSDNIEVIKQRMKERSELVRQLKEVMDGTNPVASSDGSNNAMAPAPAPQVNTNSISTNAPAPTPTTQLQQFFPTAATGTQQVPQLMTQLNSAASNIVPGVGIAGLNLGQFQNAMIGGGLGMLGLNGQFLATQPNIMVGAPATIPNVMNNTLTTPAASTGTSLQNLSIMAMQNPAVLAQLQAANQIGNVQAAMNLYQNQQVPDLSGNALTQAGTAPS